MAPVPKSGMAILSRSKESPFKWYVNSFVALLPYWCLWNCTLTTCSKLKLVWTVITHFYMVVKFNSYRRKIFLYNIYLLSLLLLLWENSEPTNTNTDTLSVLSGITFIFAFIYLFSFNYDSYLLFVLTLFVIEWTPWLISLSGQHIRCIWNQSGNYKSNFKVDWLIICKGSSVNKLMLPL